ncbi:MAG: aminomethyltransferase family protein [Desulfobacteraceae bacterium]
MEQPVKRTPLHAWHLSQGASMADFGGYEMPLWYSSVKNEHLTVLTHAGLFDTSHMALVDVRGPGAHALLQRCFTNNLDACIGKRRKALSSGRCVYGAFLDETGGVIDDGIVYKLADDHYLVVVNAGMGAEIASHLTAHQPALETTVTDMTDRFGKIDIQGPMAAKILSEVLVDAEKVFDAMPYFSFKGRLDTDCPDERAVCLKNGTSIVLSRTGYTGEFGFEMFMAADKAVAAWEAIVDAGRPHGLVACGLAARDSLRGGAVLPLSHQDIGPWPFVHHPWPFALPWTADGTGFSKPFIGDQALLDVQDPRYTYAFVGSDLRKVSTQDPAIVLNALGEDIGRVLTCVSDMGIGYVDKQIFSIASPGRPEGFKPRGLCCGFIKVNEKLETGVQVQLIDKRRTITVTVVDDIRPDRTARRLISEMV